MAAYLSTSDPASERVIREHLLSSAVAMRGHASGPTIACAHLSATVALLIEQVGIDGAGRALLVAVTSLPAVEPPR